MEAKTLAADKTPDPDAKTIKENGGFVDDLTSTFDVNNLEDSEINGVSSLLKMQESGSFKGLESVLDYLDKKEKRGFGDDGLKTDLLDADERNIDDNDDDDDREGGVDTADDQFRVGDFVWGKIRSHPWWPGRIYDPLDASDYAKKVKQRDKILVAYFGDRTFAWCNPSQLSHFEENFVEMFKQSNSKSFVNAVKEAVDEVGRLVDLKMTCSCVPQENLIGFGRSLAVNAGVKEGHLVPEGGIDKFSTALFEPGAFLPVLKDVAQFANIANRLEVAVLKNWLSAFYRAKGGYQLPTYHEPQPIPGLGDDDTRNWMMDLTDYNGGVEGRIRGPAEEDWLSSSTGSKFGQTTRGPLQKCQYMLEDRYYRKRKQKSIAKILRGDTNAEAEIKEDDVTKEETESRKQTSFAKRETWKGGGKIMGQEMDAKIQNVVGLVGKHKASSGKPASSSVRKRRRGSDGADGEGKSKVGPVAKAGSNLDKLAFSSGRENRKVSDQADAVYKSKVGDVGEAGANLGKPESTSGRKKRKVSDKADAHCKNEVGNVAKVGTNSERSALRKVSDEANADGGNDLICRLRRNKTKLTESFTASDLEVSGSGKKGHSAVENDDAEGSIDETRDNKVSAEKKMDGGLSYLRDGNEAKARIEGDSFSRERRHSKYLSPPYTNINRGQRKKELEAESEKISSDSQLEEEMTEAAGHLICEKFQVKADEETGGGHKTSDTASPQTPEQDQNHFIDLIKVEVPVSQMLSHVQSLALNPTYLKEGNCLDTVEEFVSAFRSSIYSLGSNYKMYNKHKPGRTKRESQESEPGTSGIQQNRTDQSSADYKSRSKKAQKSEAAELEKLKVLQAASATDMKTSDKGSDGNQAAAALYVTFSPGSSLPSKNDLIIIYEKFGPLNQEETEMFDSNRCARIVFLRSYEAEKAFNDSQLASPFGAARVTFQLQYLSAETKTPELREIQTLKSSPLSTYKNNLDEEFASQSSANDLSQLNYIKQKLEMMSSILETTDGIEMKSKLKGEIKGLLEKVSTMAGSSL